MPAPAACLFCQPFHHAFCLQAALSATVHLKHFTMPTIWCFSWCITLSRFLWCFILPYGCMKQNEPLAYQKAYMVCNLRQKWGCESLLLDILLILSLTLTCGTCLFFWSSLVCNRVFYVLHNVHCMTFIMTYQTTQFFMTLYVGLKIIRHCLPVKTVYVCGCLIICRAIFACVHLVFHRGFFFPISYGRSVMIVEIFLFKLSLNIINCIFHTLNHCHFPSVNFIVLFMNLLMMMIILWWCHVTFLPCLTPIFCYSDQSRPLPLPIRTLASVDLDEYSVQSCTPAMSANSCSWYHLIISAGTYRNMVYPTLSVVDLVMEAIPSFHLSFN